MPYPPRFPAGVTFDDSRHPAKGTTNTWQPAATLELHQTLHASAPYQCAQRHSVLLSRASLSKDKWVSPNSFPGQSRGAHWGQVQAQPDLQDRNLVVTSVRHSHTGLRACFQSSPFSPGTCEAQLRGGQNPLTAAISEGQGFTRG